MVIIEAGNLIPVDLRLIEFIDLELNEAALTGESMGITKSSDAITGTELGLCFLLAAVVFVAVEAEKWLVRRGVIYQVKATELIDTE